MLRGKSVVVTGASGGIGSAIARRCAAEGARVGVHYYERREPAEALARELGGVALGFDVRDTAGIAAGIETFTVGGAGLDLWVNAAGVHTAALLVSADEAALVQQISVNLLGTILCTRAVLPWFLRQKAGVVLNVSSVSATTPVPGGAAYAASKAGVEAFTRAVALEYGRKGIRAVCVRPGPIETPMLSAALALGGDQARDRTALRRFGEPADVASLAVYLLSDQARFVTGSVHAVDGRLFLIEQLLRQRRSVRRFKSDPVPEALVNRLIEGAICAPSASNKQPWKFLLVENRGLIQQLADAVRASTALVARHIPESSQAAFQRYGDYFTRFELAPLLVVPIHKPLTLLSNLTSDDLPVQERTAIAQLERDSGLIGTSLALGHLLLVAHELGLGASGMTGPLLARPELKRLLEVPPAWDIVALVPVGFPDEVPVPTERKSAHLVTRWFR